MRGTPEGILAASELHSESRAAHVGAVAPPSFEKMQLVLSTEPTLLCRPEQRDRVTLPLPDPLGEVSIPGSPSHEPFLHAPVSLCSASECATAHQYKARHNIA